MLIKELVSQYFKEFEQKLNVHLKTSAREIQPF